jgi:bZIP-type transcription factor MBZ1
MLTAGTEYIGQLEAEIANKVTENGDLRAQNRALVDENKRLSDLTRMLLSSPSFSDFLDRLSTNPTSLPAPRAQPQAAQQQEAQLPKDVSPYAAQQVGQQHHQIGMAMIPEQTIDFNMLSLDTADSTFTFQPQVYAVLETPEVPAGIDTTVLSGKQSNFVGEVFESEDEKVELPIIERPAPAEEKIEPNTVVVDEAFESDPAFALYHDSPVSSAEATDCPAELDTDGLSQVDIFGGIEPEKALARFNLVDASEEDESTALAMARVQRISSSMNEVLDRLERLTVDL